MAATCSGCQATFISLTSRPRSISGVLDFAFCRLAKGAKRHEPRSDDRGSSGLDGSFGGFIPAIRLPLLNADVCLLCDSSDLRTTRIPTAIQPGELTELFADPTSAPAAVSKPHRNLRGPTPDCDHSEADSREANCSVNSKFAELVLTRRRLVPGRGDWRAVRAAGQQAILQARCGGELMDQNDGGDDNQNDNADRYQRAAGAARRFVRHEDRLRSRRDAAAHVRRFAPVLTPALRSSTGSIDQGRGKLSASYKE